MSQMATPIGFVEVYQQRALSASPLMEESPRPRGAPFGDMQRALGTADPMTYQSLVTTGE